MPKLRIAQFAIEITFPLCQSRTCRQFEYKTGCEPLGESFQSWSTSLLNSQLVFPLALKSPLCVFALLKTPAAFLKMTPQVPKDFLKKCKKDASWCAKFSNTVLKNMKWADLVKLNCGKQPKILSKETKGKLTNLCIKEFPNSLKKAADCTSAKIVLHSFTGCGAGSLKRDANEATEGSGSTELYLGIGAVLLIIIVSAISAYCYLFGDKKGGKAAKGGSQSKMAGKSKLGSRKSQASKRSSRKGSQRSKVSGASKGTKSRMSGKKK